MPCGSCRPLPAQALSYWGIVHGIMLMLGTVVAALGFAAGIMYLLQSYRLKRKLPPRPGFRLPTLEWLQKFNRRSLLLSTFLLGLGLLAGLAVNLIRQSGRDGTVSWTDPVVISSGVLVPVVGDRLAVRIVVQAGPRRAQEWPISRWPVSCFWGSCSASCCSASTAFLAHLGTGSPVREVPRQAVSMHACPSGWGGSR